MPADNIASPPLVDRDRELDTIRRFHDARAAGPSALIIRGEPGSGRTALLTAAATTADAVILRARAQPEEATQPFVALRDMLRSVADEAVGLPPPLRAALDAALLRGLGDGDTDPTLVPPAVATLLERLADRGALLVVVDDAEWLDADTARALRFAISRMPATLSVALTEGEHADSRSALAIDRSVPPTRVFTVSPRPLTVAGIHHLLSVTFGEMPRGVVHRVASASGGNPRAAIELARAAVDEVETGTRARVPQAVAGLVERRLGRLSEAAAEATLLVALAGRLSVVELESIDARASAAVGEAEDAGAITEDDGTLRASTALVATVVLGRASPAARRAAHARLAAVASSPDDRARHLAALPDAADRVDEIDAGGSFALGRGAASAAAELYAAAVRLTPPAEPERRARRLGALARSLLAAGDPAAARDVAEEAIAGTRGRERSRMIARLADLAWADGTIEDEARRARAALADADPETRLDLTTALVAFGVADHPGQALRDADAALALVDPVADPGRAGYLTIHREMASALSGNGVSWERLADGLRLERERAASTPPSSPPLVLYTMCDRTDEARSRFADEDAWYAAHGEDGWRAERAGQLALAELRAGNTDLARRLANDAADRLDRLHVGGGWPLVFAWRSVVDAHVGATDRALRTASRLIDDLPGTTLWAAIARSTACFASYAAGEDGAALAHGDAMREILDRLGVHDLLADRSESLLAELRAAAGDVAGAETELARLERRHATLPRPWTAASLARTRAVVEAARGDPRAGLDALRAGGTEDDGLPFEAAWNRLTAGRLLRRMRDKRRAAQELAAARSAFERLGALPWIERTDRELARVGLRRRPVGELTDGELTIARLAARGLTTRQIADAAFVSPKTVEANLTRIYRKLEIGSRAELGAWARTEEGLARET